MGIFESLAAMQPLEIGIWVTSIMMVFVVYSGLKQQQKVLIKVLILR